MFDEYHEYININIFNILFAELVAVKQKRQDYDKRILLVSATPHYFYLEKILGLYINNPEYSDVKEMPSFNNSKYQINFLTYDEKNIYNNPFYLNYDNYTCVIANTAKTAQLGFIYQKDNENSILIHSKYKRSDKKRLFNEVYESFQLNGNAKYQVLRAGPIIQASLNITFDNMVSEISTAENILQRLGRLDRFGNNLGINQLTIAITEDVKQGKCKENSSRFLNSLHSFKSSVAWYKYLIENFNDRIFNLSEIYKSYRDFCNDKMYIKYIEEDLYKAIQNSIESINKRVLEPLKIMPKSNNHDNKIRIKKHSLRGDQRFVQLAKLDVSNFNQPIVLDEYAYSLPMSDKEEFDNLTEAEDIIKGSNDKENLLAYMAKKHHQIFGGTKMISDRIWALARDPENPIYLSYTPCHLDRVKIENNNSDAIYYAECEQQPIGAITLKVINNFLNNNFEE